jgi:hypothetical protein
VSEVAATKAAVAAAVVQTRQDYLYAVQHYDAADALDVLARTAVREGPSWQLAVKNIDTLKTNGWRARNDPTVPSVTTVEGDVQLLDGPPATKAEVVACTIDSGVVYAPNAAPDGSDLIVNDEVSANRDRLTLVLQNGSWKLYSGTALGTWKGATSCSAT